MHRKDWSAKLTKVLWAYRITWKNSNGFSPYQLVYGKQVLLPQQERILQLNQLDEMRQATIEHNILIQQQRAQWHNKFIKKKQFHIGD